MLLVGIELTKDATGVRGCQLLHLFIILLDYNINTIYNLFIIFCEVNIVKKLYHNKTLKNRKFVGLFPAPEVAFEIKQINR